jgi:hypothetical protein
MMNKHPAELRVESHEISGNIGVGEIERVAGP